MKNIKMFYLVANTHSKRVHIYTETQKKEDRRKYYNSSRGRANGKPIFKTHIHTHMHTYIHITSINF